MRIDHVARFSRSPQETHRFYTEVLGLKLMQAYAGKELLFIYALPDGGSLAFSTRRGRTGPRDIELDPQSEHVGLTVATRGEFDRWLQRLAEDGVPHQLVDDERIYFCDPDGLVLELEVASPLVPDPQSSETLARWRPD